MKRLWIVVIALALMGTGLNVIGCSDASMKGLELEECVGEGCEPTPEPLFDPVVIIEEDSKEVLVAEIDKIDCYDYRTPEKVELSDKVAYNIDFSKSEKRKDDELRFEDKVAYNKDHWPADNDEPMFRKVESFDKDSIDININNTKYLDSIKEEIEKITKVDIYSDDPNVPYDGEIFEIEPVDEEPEIVDVDLCIPKEELSDAIEELELLEYSRIDEGVLYLDPELNSKRSRVINIIPAKEAKCEDIKRMQCIITDVPKAVRIHKLEVDGSEIPGFHKDEVDYVGGAEGIDNKVPIDTEYNLHKIEPEHEVPTKFEEMMIEIDKGDPPPVDQF